MTHKIVTKEDGTFGLQRISSGCVYGSFENYGEAVIALAQMAVADSYRPEQ